MNIRMAAAEDVERIRQISCLCWAPIYDHRKGLIERDIFESIYDDGSPRKAEEIYNKCRNKLDCCAVACIDGQVVGFITWSLNTPALYNAELCENAVHPDFARQGIGKSLCNWLFDLLKSEGMKYVNVFTGLDAAHKPARILYESVGFSNKVPYVKYYRTL